MSKSTYLHIRIDTGLKSELLERIEKLNKETPRSQTDITTFVTKMIRHELNEYIKKEMAMDGMTFKEFNKLVQGTKEDYEFASDILHEFVLLEGESGTFEEYLYDTYKKCESCGEWFKRDDLVDTTEYINGGCGDYCEGCVEDGDMIAL